MQALLKRFRFPPSDSPSHASKEKRTSNALGFQHRKIYPMTTKDRHRELDMGSLPFLILLYSSATAVRDAAAAFSPADNYLIDCGATTAVDVPDGRLFRTDPQSAPLLSSKDDLSVSLPSSTRSAAGAVSPLYRTARVFLQEAVYAFPVTKPGWHWLRLHFLPINASGHDLSAAVFSAYADDVVLLHSFTASDPAAPVFREYLVNATGDKLSLRFSPMRNSPAFVNAIEFVSAPAGLISDSASTVAPAGDFAGLSRFAFQTVYRLNVGGPVITPKNDTLGRTWDADRRFLQNAASSKAVSVSPGAVNYPEEDGEGGGEAMKLVAPSWVYASAVEMADARVSEPKFNITWNLPVDAAFGYLVRLHFCDIVSKALNDLYFNVYINGKMAISGLDLSTVTSDLATPYYKDFMLNASTAAGRVKVQVGPTKDDAAKPNAILNGVEVMKMSNSVGSLDGEFGVDGRSAGGDSGPSRKVVAAVGFAMMLGAFVGLGAMVVKWSRRPQDWEKRNSFSSWLLPLHAGGYSSFLTSKASTFGSHKSGFYSSTLGLGRYFTLSELQEATKSFDEKAVIGVGGFGNVYLGTLDDGTKVAVKRGNPQSEQGMTEFQTEIQMLSKLRHRHLVSLMGYCDENAEMILVYEFMAQGPLRDHLYGKGLPPLSWKQRLDICIGAARGLHYLHTGAAQGIIHRDVKTTNILLDDGLVAKVADFGLSKNVAMGGTHVSTAVKGSFGYLDPEYFRRQQLTEKSDVYSFGVVLLEALCSRPAINPALPREQVNLAEWAMQSKRRSLLDKIVDPNLAGDITPDSQRKFVEAAEKCLAEHGVDRPSMGDVLWNLEYALQLHEVAVQGRAEEEQQGRAEEEQSVPAIIADTSIEMVRHSPVAKEEQETSHTTAGNRAEAVPAGRIVENSGMAVANELFAQLGGFKGR